MNYIELYGDQTDNIARLVVLKNLEWGKDDKQTYDFKIQEQLVKRFRSDDSHADLKSAKLVDDILFDFLPSFDMHSSDCNLTKGKIQLIEWDVFNNPNNELLFAVFDMKADQKQNELCQLHKLKVALCKKETVMSTSYQEFSTLTNFVSSKDPNFKTYL